MVELQADVDIVGDDLAEIGKRGLDAGDDIQRGGVGALGDGDVDGAPAVHVSVGGHQVGAVLDGGDVAQVDGDAGDRADRRGEQLREIAAEGGVGAGDALDVAGPHVPGGRDHAGAIDGGDGLLGRNAVLTQLVGVEGDHDGALAPAEGRRRGNARQRGEERAHAVEGEVLHFAQRARLAAEDKLSDGHAPGVEARDEGLHGAGGHE